MSCLSGKDPRGRKANLSPGEITLADVLVRTLPGPPNSPACRVWAGYITPSGVPVWRIVRPLSARRVVYDAFVGPLTDQQRVGCSCTTPGCVWPDCLVIKTHSESGRGRQVRPETVLKIRAALRAQAKVSAADVAAIRASSEHQAVLAARFGVSRSLVGKIKRRQIWSDAPPPVVVQFKTVWQPLRAGLAGGAPVDDAEALARAASFKRALGLVRGLVGAGVAAA